MNRCLTYQKKCTMSCISGLFIAKTRWRCCVKVTWHCDWPMNEITVREYQRGIKNRETGNIHKTKKNKTKTQHYVHSVGHLLCNRHSTTTHSKASLFMCEKPNFLYHKQHLINPGLSVCSVFNSYQTTSSHHFQSVSRNYTPPRRRKFIFLFLRCSL